MQLVAELVEMHLFQEFIAYIDSEDSPEVKNLTYDASNYEETANYVWIKHRGLCLLFGMLVLKWPRQFIDEKFYNVLCNFLHKLRIT